FHTVRSEIGEAVYRFKYCSDHSQLHRIAEVAASFLQRQYFIHRVSAVVPIPPSEYRSFQPVVELAKAIAQKLRIEFYQNVLVRTRSGTSLKNIDDPEQRQKELKGAFSVNSQLLARKNVLLVDDLYRSGSTLNEATNVLHSQGNVSYVYVITMTKTRTKR
ncbi:MAG: phosphoribosyltransferase family protein, partial [bacterium]|nr:phosphoribosyltransferase family protein [bacterium]